MEKTIYGKSKKNLMTYRNFMVTQGQWKDLDVDQFEISSEDKALTNRCNRELTIIKRNLKQAASLANLKPKLKNN